MTKQEFPVVELYSIDAKTADAAASLLTAEAVAELKSGGAFGLALVEEGDLIQIDIPARRLAIVGVAGEEKTPAEMEAILTSRRAAWQPRAPKYTHGLLRLYSQHAVSPMKGAYME